MTKSSISRVAFAAVLLLSTSCGREPTPAEGEGEGEGEAGEGEAGDDEAVAVEVVRIALTPGVITEQMLFLVVEMIGNATVLANSPTPVLTGTVVVNAAGNSYAPQPANELVQVFNGAESRATIGTFNADLVNETARDVYLDPHDVVVTAFRQGNNVLAGESHLGANDSGTRRGDGTLASGHRFSYTGTLAVAFDVDGSLAETTSQTVNTGTLSGLSFDLEFTESGRYHALVGDNVVEDLQTGLSLTGSAGGSRWNMPDALIKRTFRNGLAVEEDFWDGTTGTITRNDAAFGNLRAQIGAASFLIVLDMAARDEILEEHRR